MDSVLPVELQEFLSYLVHDHNTATTAHAHRVVLSIGQDICRDATRGQWTMPKHILMCMTLRHTFRSKMLLRLLNRFGHTEDDAFAMELEGALEEALKSCDKMDPSLVPEEYSNVVDSQWDNFNQFMSSVHGPSTMNASGICWDSSTRGQR